MINSKDLKIIPFEEKYADDFKRININWLTPQFEVTPSDEKALNNPLDEIINRNGYIFLAQKDHQIIGCIALEKIDKKTYMLSRMGVDLKYQGLKIGQRLMDVSLSKAKELNANKLFLYTSYQLVKAINLYFKNGFKAVPVGQAPVDRATLKLEKSL
ncbi:MAG: GNAT family N-acetyltransferase [Psychroflexus sp.]|uniref:GNAT family N-acetyltransferase n=1 Tax=Psychroflexus sp. S27 TaxID=1982757 RepID=UPI000C29E17B|nr:GNAT family N-acetyltransferase [Psychroflexus sp. S27]PJX24018.1 hypothetical protein CAP47_04860 [Psychroflexus sp. S27]